MPAVRCISPIRTTHVSLDTFRRPPSAISPATGLAGFKGDGGPADRAQLNKPVGITMDATGNIYVADVNNSRIRKILTDGTITTIAGKGGRGLQRGWRKRYCGGD